MGLLPDQLRAMQVGEVRAVVKERWRFFTTIAYLIASYMRAEHLPSLSYIRTSFDLPETDDEWDQLDREFREIAQRRIN